MNHLIVAAGDPIENLKSWIVAIILGIIYIAVLWGLARAAIKFTPIAIITAILLGAVMISAPFTIPSVADAVRSHSDTPTAPADPLTGNANLFGGGAPTTAAPGTTVAGG